MISDLQLFQLTLDIKTVGINASDPSRFYIQRLLCHRLIILTGTMFSSTCNEGKYFCYCSKGRVPVRSATLP